jgi:hypothetical protein
MSDYRCFPDPEGAENTINFPPLLIFFIFFISLMGLRGYNTFKTCSLILIRLSFERLTSAFVHD